MSACTECQGMAGEKYDDHVSDDCPRLRSKSMTPPPEESTLSTKSLNKYVVSIHGDQVTFTDKIWVAIEELIQEKERLARLDEVANQMEIYSYLPTDAGGLTNRQLRIKRLREKL